MRPGVLDQRDVDGIAETVDGIVGAAGRQPEPILASGNDLDLGERESSRRQGAGLVDAEHGRRAQRFDRGRLRMIAP